jgi:pimeloyl-ACP methyl ester carboxylesterase
LVAFLGAALALPLSAHAGTPPASRYERTACPAEIAASEPIDCGTLIVPESRAKPTSRMIRLPVRVMRSQAAQPASDPIVFLAGGPGNSNVAGRVSAKGNPFLALRDQILLEPRGAERAEPALECPAFNAAKDRVLTGAPKDDALLVAAATACRSRLVSDGVDLDGYTSAETADDLEDLRVALGYGKLNLYGFSYGTRLALTYLRRHPGNVRAVVLDSVLPPEVDYDEHASANLRRALNAVFDGCAVDPACDRAYPDLARRFTALIAQADRSPLALPPAKAGDAPSRADGAQVAAAVASGLEDPATIPALPRIIDAAARGRFESLAPLIASSRAPTSFTWGLRLSVWCAEEAPFENPARVAAAVSPAQGLGGLDARTASPAVCRAWGVTPAPAVENQPVKSDAPVLVFAGEFDPATPPNWGRGLLANLPNAAFVQMPGRSHGASFNGCAGAITVAFIADPSRLPPLDCAARQRGADFGAEAAKVR